MVAELYNSNIKIKFALFSLVSVVFVLLQLMFSPKAHATTYDVSQFSNPTGCGFVEAMAAINATPVPGATCAAASAPNTVNLAAGTYTLPPGLPPIEITTDGDLTISGAGADKTVFDGNGSASGFFIQPPSNNNTYNLNNLALTNFIIRGDSQVILLDSGNLNIDHIVAHNNSCGISRDSFCVLFFNPPDSITNINITSSSFFNNEVGGVFGGSLAGFSESGPACEGSSGHLDMTIKNSTFYNTGTLGFVYSCSTDRSTINLVNNTISDGVEGEGDAQGAGFIAIIAFPDKPQPDFIMQNNIINNYKYNNGESAANCAVVSTLYGLPLVTPTSLGGNISSDDTCSAFFTATNDKNNINPMLGALTTSYPFVMPITQSSPAFNNGIAAGAPATDERGVARPQFGAFDSGAYELEDPPGLPNTGNSAQSSSIPAVIATILALSGIAVAGYSLKRK